MYSVAEKDIIGDLRGFPIDVVQAMLFNQRMQCDIVDVAVFQSNRAADRNGFTWGSSAEGWDFWNEVIHRKKFDIFYKSYPTFADYLAKNYVDRSEWRVKPTKLAKFLLENIKKESPTESSPYKILRDFKRKMIDSNLFYEGFATNVVCEDFLFALTPKNKKWFEDTFLCGRTASDGYISNQIICAIDEYIDFYRLIEIGGRKQELYIKCLQGRYDSYKFVLGYIKKHPFLFSIANIICFCFEDANLRARIVKVDDKAFNESAIRLCGFKQRDRVYKIGDKYVEVY